MSVSLTVLLISAALALLLTPAVRAAAVRLRLLDAPGGRKVHSLSVPRLGGVAIVLAAALAGAVAAAAGWTAAVPAEQRADIAPLLAGAAIVFLVGVLDDLVTLPAWPKVAGQVAAAAVVMLAGLLIERITIGDRTWQLGMLAWPVTLCWIVGLTNAFNLIDGIDGLAAGIAAIAGTACLVILLSRGRAGEAMILSALVGAALGFLVYNFAPASIFLGDGGSLLFGFVLASTAISGWQKGATALAAGVPLLIFALPIADATSALARRIGRRAAAPISPGRLLRQIVEPDREHIHHRLQALGWSTPRTVLLLYAITFVLSLVALATARYE